MSAGNRTSAAKARTLEYQAQALELRRAGKGYTEIGRTLGLSRSHAHRLVQAGLADAVEQIGEASEHLRAQEVDRLDALLASVWPQARRANLGAVDRVIKIMERRARLLGLDAPEKKALGGLDGAPPVAVSVSPEQYRAIAEEVAAKT